MKFFEELKWRGMVHDAMPGTEEQLDKEMTHTYIGFDPTSDSLHIGSLVPILLLIHLQRAGHKPIALIGGATGMVGDPSGKSEERNFLSEEILHNNIKGIQKQLEKFLDFNAKLPNAAEIVNNYDWFRDMSFLNFIRDVGKHITVNYMMSKDSVKKRIESDKGISFTEFTYQLIQGYDFYYLYKNKKCKLQMGGSDQWGNIVTGTELIRRINGGEAFALTCPLIKKADGGKFGKTEKGNIWLDSKRTSPYAFYQFWMNTSDEDARSFIKIFTLLPPAEIDDLIKKHDKAPYLRILQKALAKEVTILVHSEEDYKTVHDASQILFGAGTAETLAKLDENTFLNMFKGVPIFDVDANIISTGINILELTGVITSVFPSKGEARRILEGGGLSINKIKVQGINFNVNNGHLINHKYLLIQKGKTNYNIIRVK